MKNLKILFFCIMTLSVFSLKAQERAVPSDSLGQDSLRVLSPYHLSSANWYGYDWNFFPIHEGMNASLSMSAAIGLGGDAPSGVGFGRNLHLAYAGALNKRTSYILSASTAQMDWGGFHYNQAGIGGALNFALNDRMSISVEGYKDLVRPNAFLTNQYLHRDNYLGGALNMKISNALFIQVSLGTSTWNY